MQESKLVFAKVFDRRRLADTHASRSWFPMEIASKMILYHSDPAITQIYPGKVSDEETFKWVDSLHALVIG